MPNEKEDVLQANAGAPAANIPDLKKKDKERKKAGAAWSGVRGAGGDFTGATGGSVARAAASAAGMAAEEEAVIGAESGGWAMLSRLWAGLTSTLLGKLAAASAAVLIMAGGILGYSLLKGKGNAGVGAPNLGGIEDSMRVRAGGDDRLGVASKGELRFDPLSAPKPAVAPPPAPVKAAETKPAPDVQADMDVQKPVPAGKLAHNLSGAQLTSSLGGDFGSKNIFAGNSAAPKFGAGASNLANIGGMKGHLSAMKASTLHANPAPMSIKSGSANKAFGQLRIAKGLSQLGAGSSTAEDAATSAQGAFDQQQQLGGALATNGAPGGDTVPSPTDFGAPDTTAGAAPTDPAMGGTDPGLQNALSQISAVADQAMQLVKMGTMMMALGAILIAIGSAMGMWGIPLIMAGIALMVMGMMEINEGHALAAQAIAMGQQLAQNIGDIQQGNAINYCTQQAVAGGTPVEACTPPDSVTNATTQTNQDATDVQQAQQIPTGTAVPTTVITK